jgi:hypothetical protein
MSTETQAPVFSREPNGLVALRMTDDEWSQLLLTLGYAFATAQDRPDVPMARMILRLTNRLNEGNPDFTPYAIPDAIPDAIPEDPNAWPTGVVVTCGHCGGLVDASDPGAHECNGRTAPQ